MIDVETPAYVPGHGLLGGRTAVVTAAAGAVTAAVCDVTDDSQVRALFETAVREHGRLDVVVDNAGLGGTAPLADMTDDQRVNAVAPSLAMHPHLVKVTTPELLAELTAREAFGRYAEPWEVANVIVFLASGYASYMTGEAVSVGSRHP
ncbi:SDR family oxidoreductase [Streptomyces sp. MN13]